MAFDFQATRLPGVIRITPRVYRDERGANQETYKLSEFAQNGIADRFVQDNHSSSARGVLRGLHYQIALAAQGKLIRAAAGEIFDVAVDIRRGSPTFGRWEGFVLSEENAVMLWLPPGFAHGFLALSEKAEVVYKMTAEYSPAHERGIIWNDPDIAIEWPIETPILSPKDRSHPRLTELKSDDLFGETAP